MQIQDLIKVNRLWSDIYPYLASQVMDTYGRQPGKVLELGPFAGGISIEIARRCPLARITIADERPEMVAFFRQEILQAGLEGRMTAIRSSLDKLELESRSFDIVILRGAFFFLPGKPDLMPEIYRVLKTGGLAFVGGGYGKDTPQSCTDAIAEESRVLNDRLGRRRLSIQELQTLVKQAGLEARTRICQEGGG
jgi:ubiquinone/menaquinone biosynthesis C-methylase UbiE